ncbi:MAG: gluconate 2-dehydrogenase subunit 3 family protein [Myxococcales bacterium]|nr:gluconate 2-dehydrogenase subunit 3 family protein [Myxococcales bacterium]MDP3499821.1 gluconate 2-dehydrogenase subunit 3 family protein [Myxococcales bacterium]
MTPDPDETTLAPLDDAPDELARRVFVQRLTFMGGGVVLLGNACKESPKPDAGASLAVAPPRPQALTTSHLTFTNDDFAIVAAAAERVLPKDDDAGALDANVPEYIDRILQTRQLESMKNNFVPGIAALDRRTQRMFKVGFAGATPEQQDEVLTIFKNSPETSGEARWYEMLVVLTLEGFLGDPSYGGNRDGVGWKAIGFTLVDHTPADPGKGYDGKKQLEALRCGGGKGC